MPVVACSCGKKFRASDALAGKQVNCPGCGRPLLIPQPSLLDEELARPTRPAPPSDATPRARTAQRSKAMEGGLLAVLLVVGGIVILAIGAMFISMFEADSEQAAKDEGAVKQPADSGFSSGDEPNSDQRAAPVATASERPLAGPSSAPVLEEGETPPDAAAQTVEPPPPMPETPEPTPANAPSSPPSRPMTDTIRLWRGVALAQTLPTGTAMGFSVEYEFVGQQPTGPANFFWVIESGKGQAVKQPAQLQARGTLQGFVPQFRPEHAPFNTHIEDQSGNRLSKSLALR